MNPEDQNPLHVMQAGEQVVCEIKRHPIGIVTTYVMVGFVLAALAVLLFVIAPMIALHSDRHTVYLVGVLCWLVLAVFGLCFAILNHIIYWGNRWIVTTDSITQIQQTGLFNKQASQLSLENLEDVTAEQNGPLAEMFHYGLLRVETAGERSKFQFPFCPNPDQYAQAILNARERFMQDIRTKDGGRFEEPPQPSQPPQNY